MATPYASGESVSAINYSGLSYIDGLLGGLKWGGALGTGVDLTYSFGGANSVYRAGYGNGDRMDLSDFAFADFAAVQAATTDDGPNTTIALDTGDSVTLLGVQLADLHQDDFVLV